MNPSKQPEQLEIFGTTVTFNDVELWLRSVPKYTDGHRKNHVHDYIRGYSVVEKIIRDKQNKSFYCLVNNDNQNLSIALVDMVADYFKPRYKLGSSHVRYGDIVKRQFKIVRPSKMSAQPFGTFRAAA